MGFHPHKGYWPTPRSSDRATAVASDATAPVSAVRSGRLDRTQPVLFSNCFFIVIIIVTTFPPSSRRFAFGRGRHRNYVTVGRNLPVTVRVPFFRAAVSTTQKTERKTAFGRNPKGKKTNALKNQPNQRV